MRILKLVAASALTLGAAAVPAAQASISVLSLQRAATHSEKASELDGSVAIILVATAAIIGTAIYVSTNGDDDPDSP